MSSSSERRASAKSSRSGASRTSISVTLPAAQLESQRSALSLQSPDQALKVTARTLSPTRTSPDPQSRLRGGVTSLDSRKVGSMGRDIYSQHSSGTVPPNGTPAPQHFPDNHRTQLRAAVTIENAWLSYRDRQMFRLLKHAVCAAEHSLSYEILRKVCPREAEFLRDKALHIRVRFRFGGSEFPPMIYFKIFTATSNGMGVRYLSGKRMIQPASEAARDACDLMGHRKFYDQVIQDMIHYESKGITDESDITTLKDYMQYLSTLDETPANMGGKDNTWRRLTLDALPRYTIFYDIVDFLYSRKLSPSLQRELPALLAKPLTEEEQCRQIDLITQLRLPEPRPVSRTKLAATTPQTTTRRSRQAKLRALKMKQMYGAKDSSERQLIPGEGGDIYLAADEAAADDRLEDWEEEADRLYEWTQELSFDDFMTTPRLPTATTAAQS